MLFCILSLLQRGISLVLKVATLTISLVFLCGISSFSQSVRADSVEIRFLNMPVSPLPDSIQTYSVSFVHLGERSESFLEQIFKEEVQKDSKLCKLVGFQKTDSGDINIQIVIEPYRKVESTTPTGKYAHNDRMVNSYTYEAKHRLPVFFNVTGKDKKVLIPFVYSNNSSQFSKATTKTVTNSKKIESNTSYSVSSGELGAMFPPNYQPVYSAQVELLQGHLRAIFSFLNSYYGYAYQTKKIAVYSFPTTERYPYQDLKQAAQLATLAYRHYSNNRLNVFSSYLAQAEKIWNAALKEYQSRKRRDRTDKKVALALHFNLMMAHLWSEEYDQAIYHIQQAEEISRRNVWTDYWMVFMLQWQANNKNSF